jgi:hypothetical protein
MPKFKIQKTNGGDRNTSTKLTDTDHGHETLSGMGFGQEPLEYWELYWDNSKIHFAARTVTDET